jgi:hypothetical protein
VTGSCLKRLRHFALPASTLWTEAAFGDAKPTIGRAKILTRHVYRCPRAGFERCVHVATSSTSSLLRAIQAQRGSTRTGRLKFGAHTRDLNGSSTARRDFRPTDPGFQNAKRQTPNVNRLQNRRINACLPFSKWNCSVCQAFATFILRITPG